MLRAVVTIVFVFAAAFATVGCSAVSQLSDTSEGGWFSKPLDAFKTPDWAQNTAGNTINLGPSGPVAPRDLVDASGRCAQPAQAAVAASAQPATTDASNESAAKSASAASEKAADRPVGSFAGDLASTPMPAAPAGARRVATTAPPNDRLQPEGMPGLQPTSPQLLGGVGLGMTECDVVHRAGLPSHVDIGTDRRGNRKVVLTYLSGNWPGIYRFNSGRLKEIDRAPNAENSASKAPKKKLRRNRAARAKTASHTAERFYVQ